MRHIKSDKSTSSLTAVQPKDVQPNAVDLRLGKVFAINDGDFTIDETQKVHRGSKPVELWEDGYYYLYPGSYEVIMENEVEVGQGEAGFVITRSTLNRNGVFLTSGLYDTGYNGVMAGVMHVNCGRMKIQPGTRIGQYLNFDAENIGSYDGDYGKNKDHDKKYEGNN
jgi:deoxycytidine triphosphate deaminase